MGTRGQRQCAGWGLPGGRGPWRETPLSLVIVRTKDNKGLQTHVCSVAFKLLPSPPFPLFPPLTNLPPTTNNTLEKVTFREVQNKQRKETFWKTCRIETLFPVAMMNVEQGISTGMFVLQIGPNQHFWWNYWVNIYIYCTSFSALVLKYDYQEEVCFNLL